MEERILEELQAIRNLLENQNKNLNENQHKDPNELLTAQQIHEEFNIGINMAQKIMRDPELPTQRYTRPYRVARQAFVKYYNVNRDYLKKQK